jgi:EAL domain-containing protein (putative c-di-GMP-specific phosphodiesterase class I)
MAQPFVLDGHEVVVKLSIGIAISRPEYTRAADILRDADTAVYRAKNAGKGRFAVFDAEMHSQVRERLELESDLRRAIGDNQFFLMYQPIVSLTSGDIEGFEALVRWRHPVHGLTEPSRFIPIAETTGLIVPLGAQVIRMACQQVDAWRTRFSDNPLYRRLWVSVNLSGRQIHVVNFADQIDEMVRNLGIDRSMLKLEITENIVMEHGDMGVETLRKLQNRGFSLALDDFGTGYSSLSSLHRIPVDAIKIDQSFIRKLDSQGRPFAATVQAIVDLAHNCGMQVVGEGVETVEQLVQLQTLDCDLAQGFWFSTPVPAADAERLLRDNMSNALWRQRIQHLARDAHRTRLVPA